MQVDSLWVRGALGPMTAWVVHGGFEGKHERKSAWTQIYDKELAPSMHTFVELKLDYPLQLQPGGTYGIYVHSARPGDESVVYDNQRSHVSHEDDFVGILPGLAHLSNRPFSKRGMWWAAWRQNREFVGRVSYAVRYLLWNPEVHDSFPNNFQLASAALHTQHAMSWDGLPSEIILYILNMCPHDWFDTAADKEKKAGGGGGSMSRLMRTMAERAAGAMRRVSGRFRGGRGSPQLDSDEEDDSDYSEGGGAGAARGSDDADDEDRASYGHGYGVTHYSSLQGGSDGEEDDGSGEEGEGGEDSDEMELPRHIFEAIVAAMAQQHQQHHDEAAGGAADGSDEDQVMGEEAEEVVDEREDDGS